MTRKPDNINSRYAEYLRNPGSIQRALTSIAQLQEHAYSSFKNVVGRHTDIGKAVIAIMANNHASNLVHLANDFSLSRQERVDKIASMLAPMYSMMYDRLTSESIDSLIADAIKEA